jgi:hypothetical protein
MQPTTPVSPAWLSSLPGDQTNKGRLLVVDYDALFSKSLGYNLLEERQMLPRLADSVGVMHWRQLSP